MIGFLQGILVSKTPPLLLLDVNGVGYEVSAPMTTFYSLPELGDIVHLKTHLVVREDAQLLFGFFDEAERVMFRLLIKVNGVGPKLALTILSGQTAREFHRCINNNDINALICLPGVGKKTAERLIVEMRDKLPSQEHSDDINEKKGGDVLINHFAKQEAVTALCALGYKVAEANRMVQPIAQEDKSCEDIIRLALQSTVR